jgi:hypothetical protein
MQNSFSNKMLRKTDNELRKIIKYKHLYQEEEQLAAILELENRGSFCEDLNINKSILIKKQNESVINHNDDLPLFFFPKYIIFIISALISPIVGCMLLIVNLIKTQSLKKGIVSTILFLLIYSICAVIIFVITSRNVSALVLFNLLAATGITEVLWKKYL